MRIVLAGGSGFLGSALNAALTPQGHTGSVLTRDPRRAGQVAWNPADRTGDWNRVVQAADVVVNLAGESIAGQRWSATRRHTLRESRLNATDALANAIASATRPPVFLSGSGIGFYGTSRDQRFTEASPAGHDFLAGLCEEWEACAMRAATVTRVVLLRTGVVLGTNGGALSELSRPFRFFAGGPIGSGDQAVSWIHLDDWTGMVEWAMRTRAVSGPINLTAPNPVTNRELATTLGRAMHRPAVLPAPAFAVRLAVGEMADAAILNGQHVLPEKAHALGYVFRFPEISGALADLFREG